MEQAPEPDLHMAGIPKLPGWDLKRLMINKVRTPMTPGKNG